MPSCNTYHLTWVSLTLDVGHLFTAAPVATDCTEAHRLGRLQTAVKRREAKSKGEKERYSHLHAEFQRIARRERKPSLVINAKK